MNIAIIGQGYVGLPLGIHAAKAGHTVVGFDIDSKRVNSLRLGDTESPEVTSAEILELQKKSRISFTCELEKLKNCTIFIIAVPTPLDSAGKPDLTNLKSACDLISKIISSKCLIINESTSYIGTLRNLIKPMIDKLSKKDNLEYGII
jgi:UDP-N-acetyl-D-galactosamine dehydrogenase